MFTKKEMYNHATKSMSYPKIKNSFHDRPTFRYRSITLALLTSLSYTSPALANSLLSRDGVNLQNMGVYKSVNLPSDPGSLYGLTLVRSNQFPSGLPSNSLFLLPVENVEWASSFYNSSGNKITNFNGSGLGGVSANVEVLRFVYLYPSFMQPENPHIRFGSDLILPLMVNINVNSGSVKGLGIGGSGLGDISWTPLFVNFGGYENNLLKVSGNAEFLINFPTGHYSSKDIFNIGSNETSFTLEWTPLITFRKLGNLLLTGNYQFTHVIKGNNDFVINASPVEEEALTGGARSTYTTGDVLTINNDLLYHVNKKLSIGPTFDVVDQLTNDRWSGSPVKNSGQFEAGAGVTFQYMISKRIDLQVKYVRSFAARNMPKYNVIWAQFGLPFSF